MVEILNMDMKDGNTLCRYSLVSLEEAANWEVSNGYNVINEHKRYIEEKGHVLMTRY